MKALAMTPVDVRLMHSLASALMLGVLAFALYALASWVARLPLFALSGITITGEVQHTNSVTLKANVTPKLSGSFFTVDLQQTRQIFQQLPWVRRAVVEREFPNRLRVHLEEHQPVAYWGPAGDERLINTHGEIFEPNLGELDDDNLPRLIGPDNQSALVLQAYQLLRKPYQDFGLSIAQIELTPRGSWRTRSDQGAIIELGRGSPAEIKRRFELFAMTFAEASQRWGRRLNALELADLRHENGYALRLRGVSTIEPNKGKR
ncbi:MAG: hypothetical protein RL657_371 [Pseudomonadota bacterium]|jgi:cell division protein FtsQ